MSRASFPAVLEAGNRPCIVETTVYRLNAVAVTSLMLDGFDPLLNFIGTWNDYFWAKVLTTTDAVKTLPVGITSLSNVDGGIAQHIVMAGNVLMLLPILIAFVLAQKQILKAFSYTGVK